jgi:hypothetical protein
VAGAVPATVSASSAPGNRRGKPWVGAKDVFPWRGEAATDLHLRYALAHHVFEAVHLAARGVAAMR